MDPIMTPRPWRRLQCFLLIALALSFGFDAVSAFSPRLGIPGPYCKTRLPPSLPTTNGHAGTTTTTLYNLFDTVGDLLSGPKLEPETNLPYDPPFSSELSISDGVRTFAIKERPWVSYWIWEEKWWGGVLFLDNTPHAWAISMVEFCCTYLTFLHVIFFWQLQIAIFSHATMKRQLSYKNIFYWRRLWRGRNYRWKRNSVC